MGNTPRIDREGLFNPLLHLRSLGVDLDATQQSGDIETHNFLETIFPFNELSTALMYVEALANTGSSNIRADAIRKIDAAANGLSQCAMAVKFGQFTSLFVVETLEEAIASLPEIEPEKVTIRIPAREALTEGGAMDAVIAADEGTSYYKSNGSQISEDEALSLKAVEAAWGLRNSVKILLDVMGGVSKNLKPDAVQKAIAHHNKLKSTIGSAQGLEFMA